MPTAYSGSTAINASRASARACETSFSNASAAQDRMNAAPTMASPARAAVTAGSPWKPCRRIASQGSVTATATSISAMARPDFSLAPDDSGVGKAGPDRSGPGGDRSVLDIGSLLTNVRGTQKRPRGEKAAESLADGVGSAG